MTLMLKKKLIWIKNNKSDNDIRTSLSDLFDVGDASALEKHYHLKCLILSERTCSKEKDVRNEYSLVKSLCDEQLIQSVKQYFIYEGDTLTLNEINQEYISILKSYGVDPDSMRKNENYRKYLKPLILKYIPEIQVVKQFN